MLYLCSTINITFMSKRIFTRINHPELQVINNATGEVVSGVAEVRCSSIDEFIMCFIASVPKVVSLDGNSMRVLMWCWKFSSFNPSIPEANTITNDKAFKERIRREGCEMSDSVINKAIHDLYKEDMLLKRCKGSYFLNPEYFFRGTLSSRSKIQYKISFDSNIEYNADTSAQPQNG